MELLVSHCNFTPLEGYIFLYHLSRIAITAATKHGAAAIGISASFGTLETGKIADLLVLSQDPTKDIKNTKSISLVMKGGKWYGKPINPFPSPSPNTLLDAKQITMIAVCVGLAALVGVAIAIAVYTTIKRKKQAEEVETPLLS